MPAISDSQSKAGTNLGDERSKDTELINYSYKAALICKVKMALDVKVQDGLAGALMRLEKGWPA